MVKQLGTSITLITVKQSNTSKTYDYGKTVKYQ